MCSCGGAGVDGGRSLRAARWQRAQAVCAEGTRTQHIPRGDRGDLGGTVFSPWIFARDSCSSMTPVKGRGRTPGWDPAVVVAGGAGMDGAALAGAVRTRCSRGLCRSRSQGVPEPGEGRPPAGRLRTGSAPGCLCVHGSGQVKPPVHGEGPGAAEQRHLQPWGAAHGHGAHSSDTLGENPAVPET